MYNRQQYPFVVLNITTARGKGRHFHPACLALCLEYPPCRACWCERDSWQASSYAAPGEGTAHSSQGKTLLFFMVSLSTFIYIHMALYIGIADQTVWATTRAVWCQSARPECLWITPWHPLPSPHTHPSTLHTITGSTGTTKKVIKIDFCN
jgi:hypothetical protein